MDDSEFERPQPFTQTPQQAQSADLLAGADNLLSASDDKYFGEEVGPGFWDPSLNNSAFSIGTSPQRLPTQAS
jgi:hypothetical protein